MKPFNYSGPLGERFSTSKNSSLQRCETALSSLGCFVRVDRVTRGNSASSLVCQVGDLVILVSYLTPVAYILRDGSSVTVTPGFYSRTTDKAVRGFLGTREPVVFDEPAFRDALRRHLTR